MMVKKKAASREKSVPAAAKSRDRKNSASKAKAAKDSGKSNGEKAPRDSKKNPKSSKHVKSSKAAHKSTAATKRKAVSKTAVKKDAPEKTASRKAAPKKVTVAKATSSRPASGKAAPKRRAGRKTARASRRVAAKPGLPLPRLEGAVALGVAPSSSSAEPQTGHIVLVKKTGTLKFGRIHPDDSADDVRVDFTPSDVAPDVSFDDLNVGDAVDYQDQSPLNVRPAAAVAQAGGQQTGRIVVIKKTGSLKFGRIHPDGAADDVRIDFTPADVFPGANFGQFNQGNAVAYDEQPPMNVRKI